MKKILFIEDESALQKAFGDILSESGYEMKSAMDGETGLRLVGTEKPDLILLDITLPKLNGFEVLEKLKKNPETKKIPVIILTNLEKIEDVDKAIGLGAMTYLVKAQYKLEDVIEKIKNTIKEK